MTLIKRRTLLGGIGLVLAAPYVARAQVSNKKVRFATQWVWQADHAMYTVADKSGYFRSAGLDVAIDRGFGSADNMTKLAAGALDIAIADINLLPKFNYENPDNQLISVMALFDAAPSAVLFLKSSGIKTPKDLEGKRISVTDADATTILFPIIAERNNIDISNMEFLSVASDLRDTMVLRGNADATLGYISTAVINWESVGQTRENIEFFQYNKLGLDLYSLGLVCRKDYANKNADVIKPFLAAAVKGLRDTFADPKEALQTIKQRDPLVNIDVEIKRLALFQEVAFITPNVIQNGISSVDLVRLKETTAVVAAALGVPVAPEPESLYTDAYLPSKPERLVL